MLALLAWLSITEIKKSDDSFKIYPNLLVAGLKMDGPYECIVSDMTSFYLENAYCELTLYMDLRNNGLVSYSLLCKRGERMTYIDGLKNLIWIKSGVSRFEDGSSYRSRSAYSTKDFNERLPTYNIIHPMSRAGALTDNAAMESINGYIKAKIFADFHQTPKETVTQDTKTALCSLMRRDQPIL